MNMMDDFKFGRIDIHNAPTADSVRLLSEMEAAMKKKIDSSLRLESNDFKGVLHRRFDMINDQEEYLVHFSLNGTKHSVMYRPKLDENTLEIRLIRLRDLIAEKIATQITNSLVRDVTTKFIMPF